MLLNRHRTNNRIQEYPVSPIGQLARIEEDILKPYVSKIIKYKDVDVYRCTYINEMYNKGSIHGLLKGEKEVTKSYYRSKFPDNELPEDIEVEYIDDDYYKYDIIKKRRSGAEKTPRIPRVERALDLTNDAIVIDAILMLEELQCDSLYLYHKQQERNSSIEGMNFFNRIKFLFMGRKYFKVNLR